MTASITNLTDHRADRDADLRLLIRKALTSAQQAELSVLARAGYVTETDLDRSRRLEATVKKLVALKLAEEAPAEGRVTITAWGERCAALLNTTTKETP